MMLNTHLMLAGGNPYDLANQPFYTNVYGIFYPALTYPFAKLFGASLLVHRAVTGFFIIATCVLIFLILRWLKGSFFVSASAAIFLYAHLLCQGIPAAMPDGLGLFLFLCSVFLPWRFNFSKRSLLASILLTILAFMTKPYFILAFPYLAFYIFLFKSKKLSLQYVSLSFIFLLLTIFVINIFFETYFNNTFFFHFNIAAGNRIFNHAIRQLSIYRERNFSIFFILFIAVLSFGYRVIKVPIDKNKLNILAKFQNVQSPFLKIYLSPEVFFLCLSFLLFYFILGRHVGNWMNYLYELTSPFLLISSLRFLDSLWPKKIIYLLCSFLIVINLLTLSSEFNLSFRYETHEWDRVSTLISEHQEIYNPPLIVPLLIEQDRKVYDSGYSQYFGYGAKRKFFNISFPSDSRVEEQNNRFFEEIQKMIRSQAYDLVFVARAKFSIVPQLVDRKWLEQCYEYQETLPANMPIKSKFDKWKDWSLEVWTPMSSSCQEKSQ